MGIDGGVFVVVDGRIDFSTDRPGPRQVVRCVDQASIRQLDWRCGSSAQTRVEAGRVSLAAGDQRLLETNYLPTRDSSIAFFDGIEDGIDT
jgi:hypothetical protein